MPDERIMAIDRAHQFLVELVDPKRTPKVPKAIRKEALSILRHHPSPYYTARFIEK